LNSPQTKELSLPHNKSNVCDTKHGTLLNIVAHEVNLISNATIGSKWCNRYLMQWFFIKHYNIFSKNATLVEKSYNPKQKCNICEKMLECGVEMQYHS